MNKTNPLFYLPFVNKMCLFTFIWASLIACQRKEEIAPTQGRMPTPSQTGVSIEKLTQYLASTTGFDPTQIIYLATDSTFVINDDILAKETDVRERHSRSMVARTDQWRYNYLVSKANVTNIDYFFESTVPASWKTATLKSIQNWNAINGTSLYLRETTTRNSADVVIKLGYAAENWVARAYLPSYTGKAGFEITINSKYNSISESYKVFTMTHEMGHTFGLMHTDQNSGIFISGTPTKDANSVMNSVVLPWQAFTAGDIKAVQTIYP